MKNIIVFFIFIFTINASCQLTAIVPLKSVNQPNGVYEKDLDIELPFWIGTWEGISNNKKYTFQFVLFTQHKTNLSEASYFYRDELMGKFKVVDLITNQVLYDNLAATNYENYEIRFLANRYTEYTFGFTDIESRCLNSAQFILAKDASITNQIVYKNFELSSYYEFWDCPYVNRSDIPVFLPTVNLVLTKQ
jgi:hypothetical protein